MSSSDASFDAMAYARQDLSPILVQMIALTEKEGQLEQAYYFENLHKALEEADNQGDLIEVFFNLWCFFQFSCMLFGIHWIFLFEINVGDE